MQSEQTRIPTGRTLIREVARRLPRRLARAVLAPTPLLVATLAAVVLVLAGGQSVAYAPTPVPADYAARYVAALERGSVDDVLASLAPEARAGLAVAARRAFGSAVDGERRAAEALVRTERVDRATPLGRYDSPSGSFAVYAAERDTPGGTQAYPLIVWLDREGRVLRTTP